MLCGFSPCVLFIFLASLSLFVQAQSCEEYFENSLHLASQLKRPVEFRVRMGMVVNGRVRGEQLFGAGRVAVGESRETLEGGAYFHWVERRDDRDPWTAPYRFVRKEEAHISMSRSGHSVIITITGGKKAIRLAPQCSDGPIYFVDKHDNGITEIWVFNFPFPHCLVCQSASVLTQHNDIGRTGANLNETILTPQAVEGRGLMRFEHAFTLNVDGQIYAQPLYVPGVKLADGTYHNVLYVATSTNHVYAFDADDSLNTSPLYQVQVGVPADPSFLSTWNPMYPYVGISATPAIDQVAKKMYVEAKVVRTVYLPSKKIYRYLTDEIFALDITSLQTVDWAEIGGTYQGLTFDPALHKSRPGLLLMNGRVYAGFGELDTEGDPARVYHGWVFSFDASNLANTPVVYSPTPNYAGGGIWQSGGGLASDGTYIYVNTGNGSVESQGDFQSGQIGDSVLKLNADLTLAQSYVPPNVKCLDTCDLDLGSAGPVLFPNSDTLLSGGKEGIFYVFSRKDISNLNQCAFRAADQKDPREEPVPYCSIGTDQNGCETPDPAKFCNGNGGLDWQTEAHGYSNIHGSPVVLSTGPGQYQVYVWPEENYLKMFKYSGGQLAHNATLAVGTDAKAPPSSMPGGILSVSSAPDGSNGIVWATVPQDCTNAELCQAYAGGDAEGAIDASVPGVFAAFDANTLAELWSDNNVGYFAKFTPPTVANGKVYVANFGDLSETCGGNYNQGQPTVACGHVRVYGLRKVDFHIPIELTRWPYIWVDPGPLTPGELEVLRRERRGD